MPIIAHRTVNSKTKPGGAIDAVFEYDWHTGRTSRQKWRLAAGTDVDTFRAGHVPKVEAAQAEAEISGAMLIARKGQNPDKVPPDHQTQIEFDRRLIAALMQDTSIETTIAALPFWTAHQARSGNNNPQRAATLGVPTAEYAEADSRFGVAQGIAGGVDTWKSETWDILPSGSWS